MKTCSQQDPGEKSNDPTRDGADLPVSVQESLAEARVNSGLRWVRGTDSNSFGSCGCWLTPTSSETTWREHSHAHQSKIGLKIY